MSNYRSTNIGFRNVTNPEPMPQVPTPRQKALTKGEDALRIAIGGTENAAMRRIILYGLAVVFIITAYPLVSLIPIILLLATDDLR